MENNMFNSKEFTDNIMDQTRALQKIQMEAYKQGYAKGFNDGKNAELEKQMAEQAKIDSLEGIETTLSKVQAEIL